MSLEKVLQKNFSKKNKIIPSKFHYDLQGSKYFEKITKTKEYYVTRIEKKILKKIANQINSIFGNNLTFVEFGSGSDEKIRILLNNKVKFYVPLDISFDFINESSVRTAGKILEPRMPGFQKMYRGIPVLSYFAKPIAISSFRFVQSALT